jgi:DNA-binding LytR/AlgR family response regulator
MTDSGDKLRVAIADDERPARSFLAAILHRFDDVEIVGEAANGMDAVAMIESTRPDLALLDLHMPEVDGLGVIRLLKKNTVPLIAFVTAYDEYAVRAFEVNAVDYVLKPVEPARLRQTIDRARERSGKIIGRRKRRTCGQQRQHTMLKDAGHNSSVYRFGVAMRSSLCQSRISSRLSPMASCFI